MKKLFYLIYSIFVGAIFLTALTFLSVKIYQEYSHGDLRTQVRFDKLCNNVKMLSGKTSNINNNFLKQIENAVGDKNDFAYLEIKVNGKDCFNKGYVPGDSKLVKSSNRSFTTGNNSVYISGSLYIIRPSLIYYYGKITFIIILFFTIITIILIIYVNVKDSKKTIYKDEDYVQPKVIPLSIPGNATSTIVETSVEDPSEAPIEENIVETNEEVAATEPASEPVSTPVTVQLPSEDVTPMKIDSNNEPAGLFSPITGIGWESYLLTRLENELNRATASEIDLSLFVIRIPDVSRTEAAVKEICEYLCVEFQFKDLIFEYKDDCIVAMKISMNVDEAIVFADKLYVEINSKLKELNSKCFIGISTRTIRMLSGERLLKEADEALKHAQEDNEGIIAFRADADKYRKFLENNA